MTAWGIDYASVDGNKPPSYRALIAAGASFVWIRGSYAYWNAAHAAHVVVSDPAFARDWSGLGSTSLRRGAYLFPVPQAVATPEEQVGVFSRAVAAAGGLRPGVDFPPCLDVEFPNGIAGTKLTRPALLDWIRRAVAAMRKEFGCWPIIYTSGRVWNDHDADCLGGPAAPDLVDCPLWLARYAYKTRQPAVLPPPASLQAPPVPSPWGDEWHAHQYQGDALGVPGFTSTVDVDVFRTARLGDLGGHVAWAQRKLGLVADGNFGPKTDAAVKAFQTSRGLAADGVIGPGTFAALAWRS